MVKSSMCSMMVKASWVITALAAINVGLTAFDMNIFMSNVMNNMPGLIVPLHIVIGVAGVFSLYHYFTNHCK